MGKLACNIAMYHPDLRVLAARYRSWHVKALLEEASILIERCLNDHKEFCGLDYDWSHFRLDLKTQERQLELERQNQPEEPAISEPAPAEEEAAPEEEAAAEEEPASEEEAETEGEAPVEEPEPAVEAIPQPAPPPKNFYEIRVESLRDKKELAVAGQPFALNYQRDLVLIRLCRDFEEAVNRAWVAEQGLKKFYDHGDLTSPLPTEAETLAESVTSLAIWIRNATEWLTRYEQHEETFTRVVSIRALLGRTAWQVLKQSRDNYVTKFRVPPELFRNHDNVLLKGIGAWLIGEVGAVPWSMLVRIPDEALYERWGQSAEVDQSGRAACLLGRVENRRSVHPVEHCGTMSLLNASPIGRGSQDGMWSLELTKPFGAVSESFGHVEDIVLEISAAGIPQRSMG